MWWKMIFGTAYSGIIGDELWKITETAEEGLDWTSEYQTSMKVFDQSSAAHYVFTNFLWGDAV